MKKTNFNDGWSFTKEGGTPRLLNLPHDAMLEEAREAKNPSGNGCACFAGGKYEYQKKFFVPENWREQDVAFEFEGVYPQAEVFLNGEKIGECVYGYSDYYFEAKNLRYGAENVLQVVVDNTAVPNSRWYSGAGIYRPVWLWTGAKSHILPAGVRVKTLCTSPAEIEVDTKYVKVDRNKAADVGNVDYTAHVEILDGRKIVATADGENARISLPEAKLWSAEHPHLYECHVTLVENGIAVDEETVTFGIRQIAWSTDGLFVNGERTLLKGGCIHHDNGILGARTYKESERRRIARMKEFGFNAIRSAHNPAGKDLLDVCDELGMYVMDEGWDMWYEAKNVHDYANRFMEHYEEDICSMVDKDYNHPSVIMYSIGNEVTEPEKEKGVELARKLMDDFHAADDTRPVTAGINITLLFLARMGINLASAEGQKEAMDEEKQHEMAAQTGAAQKVDSTYFNKMVSERAESMKEAANRDEIEAVAAPVLDLLDIAGYNYAVGRYPMEGEKHPNRVVVGSETYPYDLARTWKVMESCPYVVGDFMWTAWDYLGEAGIGAWTYDKADMAFGKTYPWLLADTGAFDILGNDTAEAGLAAVVWGKRKTPYIGVCPVCHDQKDVVKAMWRGSNALPYWSYEGGEGNEAVVEVYSMAHEVELFVNDVSVGRKRLVDAKAVFTCTYVPGTIKAVVYDENGTVVSESGLTSAKGRRNIQIRPEHVGRASAAGDFADVAGRSGANAAVGSAEKQVGAGQILYVDISVRGENGEVECNRDSSLKVSVEGGELLAFGSARPKTEEDFLSGEYATYYGRSQAVIRVGDGKELTIRVEESEEKYGYADEKTIGI